MAQQSNASYQLALRDFEQARKRAVMHQFLARLRGDNTQLLPFDTVREHLHDTGKIIEHGVREIPLDRIVGSVNRYKDFTRDFLPIRTSDAERWAGVRAAVNDMVGIPPIDVYQVGDLYFVQDGNHRVSVARALGTRSISARVTEIVTRVPLSADDDPNELICKSYYADFLDRTDLDVLRPGADLLMTFCGKYDILLDQIEGQCVSRALPWQAAVVAWYDNCYLPVVALMRELGVLRYFPDRTECDLYVLLSERRAELEARLGWHVELESGIAGLIPPAGEEPGLLRRMVNLNPPPDSGPRPGVWRQQQLARKRITTSAGSERLFEHLLVPINGTDEGWDMLAYVLKIAQRDGDHVLGLHVVREQALVDSDRVRRIRDRFEQRCSEAGIDGEFAVDVGTNPVRVILDRVAWADFVIVNGTRPPDNRPLERISPELQLLVEQCPRPMMIWPDGTNSDCSRALLAYDGSSKADEALFIATYFAVRWKKALTVVTVETAYTSAAMLDRARDYLVAHGVDDAQYVLGKGSVADNVLQAARDFDRNLLFLGGFSFRTLFNMTLGSEAERILREFPNPVWICR